jgi:acyl carrier protein
VDRGEIQEKVCSILAEQLAVDAEKVTPDARFGEDLDADSLDLVEAVLALEEEFGVSIPEEEMENVKTVGQAIDLIEEKLSASA